MKPTSTSTTAGGSQAGASTNTCLPRADVSFTHRKGPSGKGKENLVSSSQFRIRNAMRTLVVAAAVLALCGYLSASEPFDPEPVFGLRAEEAHGYSKSGMNLSQYESVNLANGNLVLTIPLGSVATDGGLGYAVNAHYNSKVRGNSGEPTGTNYYRGVESFGLGWDVRPPRLSAKIGCKYFVDDDQYPDCDSPDDDVVEYRFLSYVTASGAEHRLISVPPPQWSQAVPDDGDDYDEDCSGTPSDPLPHDFDECTCSVHPGKKQVCFTWNEPLLRVTVEASDDSGQGSTVTATVEDDSGGLRRFDHLVDTRARAGYSNGRIVNFREDVDGLYLTSLERGPWTGGVASNVISFEYCTDEVDNSTGQPGRDGLCDGGEDHLDPWLVTRVTANGELPRSLAFTYSQHSFGTRQATMLDSVTVPAFGGGTTEVRLVYDDEPVNPYPDSGWPDWDAPFLTSITAGSLPSSALTWAFSTWNGDADQQAVLVTQLALPTGANIHYRYQSSPSWRRCSLSELEEPSDPTGWFGTNELYTRTVRSLDATGDERVETTAFGRNLNCLFGPHEDQMPYPESPFFDAIPHTLGGALYYWVWVETYAGDDDPVSTQTNSTAALHRFHPKTLAEFSVDHFSTIPSSERAFLRSTVYSNQSTGSYDPVGESFLLGWDGVEVLRHQQIHRTTQFGDDETLGYDDIPCCPYPWEFFYNTVDWSLTMTNEGEPAGSSDVRRCRALTGDLAGTVDCQEVYTSFEVNDFFQTLGEHAQVNNPSDGLAVSRYASHYYDPPYVATDPAVWDLGKRTVSMTSEGPYSGFVERLQYQWGLVADGSQTRSSPPAYRRCDAPKLYRHFVRGKGNVEVRDGTLTVTYPRRAHNPILRTVPWENLPMQLAGLGGLPLRLRFS